MEKEKPKRTGQGTKCFHSEQKNSRHSVGVVLDDISTDKVLEIAKAFDRFIKVKSVISGEMYKHNFCTRASGSTGFNKKESVMEQLQPLRSKTP